MYAEYQDRIDNDMSLHKCPNSYSNWIPQGRYCYGIFGHATHDIGAEVCRYNHGGELPLIESAEQNSIFQKKLYNSIILGWKFGLYTNELAPTCS